MARARPPLWLATPSRLAGLTRPQAIVGLVLLAIVLLAALGAVDDPAAGRAEGVVRGGEADVVLYQQVVDGVRAGGNYYAVAADALRAGDYPLRPFVTFRLPTLAVVEAHLPAAGVIALLYLLAAAVGLAWAVRLRPAFARGPPFAVALILLAAGLVAFVQPELVAFHEIWAGLLIALALARRRRGRWLDAVAIGVAAMLVRETAALFVLVMAILAALEGERREACGWALAIAIFAGVVALHVHAVAQVVRPLDPHSPGWGGMLGFGFFVQAVTLSTALRLLPSVIAALLTGLALCGWAGWREPLALRALATFALYAMLIGVAGRADTFYWALLVAPTLLVGLAFVPDALRDLVVAALDRRRIVVKRLSR